MRRLNSANSGTFVLLILSSVRWIACCCKRFDCIKCCMFHSGFAWLCWCVHLADDGSVTCECNCPFAADKCVHMLQILTCLSFGKQLIFCCAARYCTGVCNALEHYRQQRCKHCIALLLWRAQILNQREDGADDGEDEHSQHDDDDHRIREKKPEVSDEDSVANHVEPKRVGSRVIPSGVIALGVESSTSHKRGSSARRSSNTSDSSGAAGTSSQRHSWRKTQKPASSLQEISEEDEMMELDNGLNNEVRASYSTAEGEEEEQPLPPRSKRRRKHRAMSMDDLLTDEGKANNDTQVTTMPSAVSSQQPALFKSGNTEEHLLVAQETKDVQEAPPIQNTQNTQHEGSKRRCRPGLAADVDELLGDAPREQEPDWHAAPFEAGMKEYGALQTQQAHATRQSSSMQQLEHHSHSDKRQQQQQQQQGEEYQQQSQSASVKKKSLFELYGI